MAEDWFADVRKYADGADENVVRKIVTYLGIALRNRDSSLVSFSDPEELGRVRERFLRKKLALTDSDDVLNASLDWVKELMSGDRTKNRVTVYYLLAHYFGKLDLFGGQAGTSAASLGRGAGLAGAASLAGIGAAGAVNDDTQTDSAAATKPAAPSDPIRTEATNPHSMSSKVPESAAAAASVSSAAPASPQASYEAPPASDTAKPQRPTYAGDFDDGDERSGWPKWLTWLLIALAVIALFFLLKSCMADRQAATTDVAGAEPAASADTTANAATAEVQGGEAAAVPTGAGVVSGVLDNKPMLTIYFESGQAGVSNDMGAAASTLKSYLDANPGAKLAVSGYNDPSGNAALNAELSKTRAQAVAAALVAAGIPEGSVELVKPADTTSGSVTPEQARRVEVTVRS
jgi:outer membrane protein OmpA-like peptidoglycan-associated protein